MLWERHTKMNNMDSVDEAVQNLIEAIRNSEVYRHYDEQKRLVKEQPELKAQIDEYRSKNYELQSGSDFSFSKIDEFEREHVGFRDNPLVSEFLAAELAFCRMMQELGIRITEAMDFE